MTSQYTPRPPAYQFRPMSAPKDLTARQETALPERWLSPDQTSSAQRLIQQLFQSLGILGRTSDLALIGQSASAADQDLCRQLQPHARCAEAAVHELRDLRLVTSPLLTDLSQSLTVLVLAADMIGNGQLAGSEVLAFYELLRRNTETATHALIEIVKQFEVAKR